MIRTLIAAAMMAAISSPSWAGFVENRAQWNALGKARQADYVMGLLDSMTIADIGDPLSEANAFGIFDCTRSLGLNNIDLVTIIDEGYARDAARWGDFPAVVLTQELFRVCRTQINARRAPHGIQLLPE